MTAFRVPVETPSRHYSCRVKHAALITPNNGLVVCVSNDFGDIDSNKLVERLEIQSILGVHRVDLYSIELFPVSLVKHCASILRGSICTASMSTTRLRYDRQLHGRLVNTDYSYINTKRQQLTTVSTDISIHSVISPVSTSTN
jgi:hypothetical protein